MIRGKRGRVVEPMTGRRLGGARGLVFAAVLVLAIAGAQAAGAVTVYVCNEKDNTISVIDGETLKVTATVPVGQRARGIILSCDKTRL